MMIVDSDSESDVGFASFPAQAVSAVSAPTVSVAAEGPSADRAGCIDSSLDSIHSTPIYAEPASGGRDIDPRIRRSLFGASPLTAWSKNGKGNYTRYVSSLNDSATIFAKDGRWKYVVSGKFSRESYSTDREAATAFQREYDN